MTDSAGYESSASNQSTASSVANDRGTFYAIYLYISSKSSNGSSARAEESKGSLSLLATDLGAAAETDLRCFLLKKVARDLQDSRGNVDVVELSLGDKTSTPMACFHQAFRKDSSASEKKSAHVLCFVSPDDGTLDLFFSDVESFGRTLVPSLVDAESEFRQAPRDGAENWHGICVRYVCRCVAALGENLAVLLHFVLNDGDVDVDVESSEAKADFERFVDACKLDVLDSGGETTRDRGPRLALREEDGRFVLSRSETSQFCRRWTRAFLGDGADDPLFLRRIVEGFRVKTIQDMNLVKRLVKLAEKDHYALYNAYKFLKECGYSETLLRRATGEGSVTATSEGREVVDLLRERLAANDEIARHVDR